jgi:VanZ family protein
MDAGGGSRWRVRLWRYGPVLVWMAVIFFASTGNLSASNTSRIVRPLLLWLFPEITEEGLLQAHFIVRKGAHLTEYAILSILAARAFLTSSDARLRRLWYVVAFALVVVYALLDEFHQSFVRTRTGTIYDSLIDIAGGALGLLIVWTWRAWRRRASGEVMS